MSGDNFPDEELVYFNFRLVVFQWALFFLACFTCSFVFFCTCVIFSIHNVFANCSLLSKIL